MGCFIVHINLPEATNEGYVWDKAFTTAQQHSESMPTRPFSTKNTNSDTSGACQIFMHHVIKCHLERSLLSPISSTLLNFSAHVTKVTTPEWSQAL